MPNITDFPMMRVMVDVVINGPALTCLKVMASSMTTVAAVSVLRLIREVAKARP